MMKKKTESEMHLEHIKTMIKNIEKNKDNALNEIDKGLGWQKALEMLNKQKDYFEEKVEKEKK